MSAAHCQGIVREFRVSGEWSPCLLSQWRYAIHLRGSGCHKNCKLLHTRCVSEACNAPDLFSAVDPDGGAYNVPLDPLVSWEKGFCPSYFGLP